MTNNANNNQTGKNNLYIDYERHINKMILYMIKNILKYCSHKGLPGNHHFYIKFKTNHPDFLILNMDDSVDMDLLEKYPNEMTILLQESFSNLTVDDKIFSVILSFKSEKKKLIIPFDSLLTFFDPFANFSVKIDSEKINDDANSNDLLDFLDYDFYEFEDEDYDDENLDYDFDIDEDNHTNTK
jgi:hypothetical protein